MFVLIPAHAFCLQYEPVIEELRRKHEIIIKEKMMVTLKNDRLEAQVTDLKNAAAQAASQPSPRRSLLLAPPPLLSPAGPKGPHKGATSPVPALGMPSLDAAKGTIADVLSSAMRPDGPIKAQRALPVRPALSDVRCGQIVA